MGLSNAEKQAAYRARYAEYKQRVTELEAEVARLKDGLVVPSDRMEQFVANIGALLLQLQEEGRKDLATFSPNTVRRYTTLLLKQLDAVASGSEPPALTGADKKRADILRKYVVTESLTAPAVLRELRKVQA